MQRCQGIYVLRTKHLFLQELYFGFFKNFKDLIKSLKALKKPKYNSRRNKYLVLDIYIYINIYDDRNIVIKKADKGSCVVIWDRNDYITEVESLKKNQFIKKFL